LYSKPFKRVRRPKLPPTKARTYCKLIGELGFNWLGFVPPPAVLVEVVRKVVTYDEFVR